uniref:CD160 molecule n=1 Tax=Marmota marmota marmota TaxID=9994 RepID=A0A8C6EV32_MARMA
KEVEAGKGCRGLHITSSASQHGEQLTLICTLWHKREAAEGFIVFLCKDRSWNCSSEVSLKQLRPKRDPKMDDVSEKSSQLVYTINRVTPGDIGTYQCCARSQKLGLHLQGHFFSVLVTETGNYTVTGLKQRTHPEVSQSGGALSSGLPQEKPWFWLFTSLVAFRGMFRRTHEQGSAVPLLPWLSPGGEREMFLGPWLSPCPQQSPRS